MKAKSNYSRLVETSAVTGTVGIFGGITIFIGAFAVWSACCMSSAIVGLFS